VQRIIVTRYGPPEVLRLEEAETPAPAEGEVLVRVARAGINFADLLARMGLYPGVPKPPFVPGHEVAGTVAALGPAVDGLAVGDRVVAGRSFGGYASHTVAPREAKPWVIASPIPCAAPVTMAVFPSKLMSTGGFPPLSLRISFRYWALTNNNIALAMLLLN
jgi:NADPH:quinone reductase-like Zn-dependent oxidoreductase